jgi:hypothetical protein
MDFRGVETVTSFIDAMVNGWTARFSEDRRHRYDLVRPLAKDGKVVNFIALNPSTADETTNDPTVRRCIGFADSWGARLLVVTNIFAFRATDPRVMKKADDPVGPDNNAALIEWATKADVVVAAWGTHGAFKSRGQEVLDLLSSVADLHALGLTNHGHPKHPLYLARNLVPFLWKGKS